MVDHLIFEFIPHTHVFIFFSSWSFSVKRQGVFPRYMFLKDLSTHTLPLCIIMDFHMLCL